MDMGTHDPLRGIDREAAFTVHPPDHALERERRGTFCHTCGKWIEWPEPQSYRIMPDTLAARGDAGWLDDGDRDSGQAARLAELVREMDAACAEILAREVSSGQLELRAVARRWQAIRKITQSNQTNEVEQ